MPELVTNYDQRAPDPHLHICTNPAHAPARTWTCSVANCLSIPVWPECAVCRPRVPPPPPCTAGCPCPSRVTPLQESLWV
jgi:hypothetical protein